MKAYKKIIGTAFVAVCLIIVIVTFIKVKGINSSDKLVLQLAHNQSAGSEIADSIAKVSDFAAKESGDEVNIKIFASGVLGTEKEEIEMVKAGIIDMAKVSSNTLGQFDDRYAIFAIPYLFKNQEHYYNAMEKSEAVKELFADTADDGYIAVGYYANGARNFYLKDDVPVTDTSVLSGKKIRSMPSSTSMDMIEKMGGTRFLWLHQRHMRHYSRVSLMEQRTQNLLLLLMDMKILLSLIHIQSISFHQIYSL